MSNLYLLGGPDLVLDGGFQLPRGDGFVNDAQAVVGGVPLAFGSGFPGQDDAGNFGAEELAYPQNGLRADLAFAQAVVRNDDIRL